jgi:hypothetical protein
MVPETSIGKKISMTSRGRKVVEREKGECLVFKLTALALLP